MVQRRTERHYVTESTMEMLVGWFNNTKWMGDAICDQTDPDAFFPVEGKGRAEQTREAKKVCNRCPALADCRAWVLAHPEERGIWGGLDEAERDKLCGKGVAPEIPVIRLVAPRAEPAETYQEPLRIAS